MSMYGNLCGSDITSAAGRIASALEKVANARKEANTVAAATVMAQHGSPTQQAEALRILGKLAER